MLSFGTAFGAFGVIFTSMEFDPMLVPILAAVISVGISALLFFIMLKVFVQTQVDTTVNLKKLVGQEAIVTVAIKPPAVGQIMITTKERGRTLITASAEDDIPSGENVIIDRMVGSTAYVKQIEGLVE
jgi:membrane protein implicated in regulation of membrane protease activity